MNTETFTIPSSFYAPIKGWSNEDLGALFRAIFEWQTDGIEYPHNDNIGLVFGLIKASVETLASLSKPISRKKAKEPVLSDELKASIDRIYKAYPAKCPTKGSSTGKGSKSKDTIEVRLREYSEEYLLKAIKMYVDSEYQAGRWVKNFNTFLNNIPDLEDESVGGTMGEQKIVWHINPTNNRRTGTEDQYESDVKRYGRENIKYIGNAK